MHEIIPTNVTLQIGITCRLVKFNVIHTIFQIHIDVSVYIRTQACAIFPEYFSIIFIFFFSSHILINAFYQQIQNSRVHP